MVELDTTLRVRNKQGKFATINVIDIIEDTETAKMYICYNFANNEQIFVSNLTMNNGLYNLDTVSEEERNSVEQILIQNLAQEVE